MTYQLTEEEKKRYVLAEERDLLILEQCNKLESLEISEHDREQVAFIKTQLEKDWRQPLLDELEKMLRKYNLP